MRTLPGPAPTARYGVSPVTGPGGAAKTPTRSPFDRAFANQPIITGPTCRGTTHGDRCRSRCHNLCHRRQHSHNRGRWRYWHLIDNASAFTLTINARLGVDASQTWTNNSGNLFTVSGATLGLGENNTLTVNGTGNTLISAVTDGAGGSVQPLLRTVAAR